MGRWLLGVILLVFPSDLEKPRTGCGFRRNKTGPESVNQDHQSAPKQEVESEANSPAQTIKRCRRPCRHTDMRRGPHSDMGSGKRARARTYQRLVLRCLRQRLRNKHEPPPVSTREGHATDQVQTKYKGREHTARAHKMGDCHHAGPRGRDNHRFSCGEDNKSGPQEHQKKKGQIGNNDETRPGQTTEGQWARTRAAPG